MATSVRVLGVRVDAVDTAGAVARIGALVEAGGHHQVATVNPEFIMLARRDPEFARILEADAGRVTVRRKVAGLLELGAGFVPEYTGRENIFLNASILGLSRRQIESRFDSIVDFAELGDAIDASLATYSSGMYMRLGFSMAMPLVTSSVEISCSRHCSTGSSGVWPSNVVRPPSST